MVGPARQLAYIVREGAHFLPESDATRQIAAGADAYEVLGEPTRAVRRWVLRRYGRHMLIALRRLHERFDVTEEIAETYWTLLRTGAAVGRYDEVRAVVVQASAQLPGLGRILHADHAFEQRLHRMLRDGSGAHAARSPGISQVNTRAQRKVERRHDADLTWRGETIQDGFTFLVPSIEVASYRMARQLRRLTGTSGVGWFYTHTGLASKTSRMADIFPYRLEGAYTYDELLNGTLWVLIQGMGMDPRFVRYIYDDFIHSILLAVANDPRTAEMILRNIRRQTRRRLSADNDTAIEAALRQMIRPRRSFPTDYAKTWRYQAPILRRFDIPEHALEHGLRDIEAGLRRSQTQSTPATTGP